MLILKFSYVLQKKLFANFFANQGHPYAWDTGKMTRIVIIDSILFDSRRLLDHMYCQVFVIDLSYCLI